MAQVATQQPTLDEAPSLDPAAIERAYRRERSRRDVRSARREFARSSNARFYLLLAFLLFVTVLIALSALRVIYATFGI